MFEQMKKAIEEESGEIYDYQFAYDGPYSEYVNGIYGDAVEQVSQEVGESINVEASIQCGCGRNDMYCESGHTSWDFEDECDTLLEYAQEAETEEEFKNMIAGFLRGKWEDCVPEEDEEDEEDEEESAFDITEEEEDD